MNVKYSAQATNAIWKNNKTSRLLWWNKTAFIHVLIVTIQNVSTKLQGNENTIYKGALYILRDTLLDLFYFSMSEIVISL